MDHSLIVPFLTLAVTYRARQALILPPFAANLWRGVWGKALKTFCCLGVSYACPACEFKKTCVYPYYFDQSPTALPGRPSPPRPYVLHIPWLENPQPIKPGQDLGFSLTLFGTVQWDTLLPLIESFNILAHHGLGKERAQLTLKSIDLLSPDGKPQERLSDGQVIHPVEPEYQPMAVAMPTGSQDRTLAPQTAEIEIDLATPLILTRQGSHLDQGLPLRELLLNLVRRGHQLKAAWVTYQQPDRNKVKVEETTCLKQAEDIVTVEDNIHWQSHTRYSGRQKQVQSLSGLMGKAAYTRIDNRLLDLLRFGVLAHAGKSASLGMGAYELKINHEHHRPPFWMMREEVATG